MSKKAAIFGIGQMGKVISSIMVKLGYRVSCCDVSSNNLKSLEEKLPSVAFDGYLIRTTLEEEIGGILKSNHDVVISSLPYHQTETVAKHCIDNGIRYCDLGGRVDVSERINSYAKKTGSGSAPVMTDLGLAPGWVNILSEWGFSQLDGADSIKMMVGGIPLTRIDKNPLNYVTTWSVDGLINEYRDDCEILSYGEIKKATGMSGLEDVEVGLLGTLEAFNTSGGASHTIESMKARGVQHCSYKTLRYKGHRDIVRFLIRDCFLPDKCLKQIFQVGCSTNADNGDIVIIMSEVKKGDLIWKKEKIVNTSNDASAMQRATATPISVVADMLAQGRLDGKSSLSYADIPFSDFDSKLKELLD
jgi:lysine 6-dehydrogenase